MNIKSASSLLAKENNRPAQKPSAAAQGVKQAVANNEATKQTISLLAKESAPAKESEKESAVRQANESSAESKLEDVDKAADLAGNLATRITSNDQEALAAQANNLRLSAEELLR